MEVYKIEINEANAQMIYDFLFGENMDNLIHEESSTANHVVFYEYAEALDFNDFLKGFGFMYHVEVCTLIHSRLRAPNDGTIIDQYLLMPTEKEVFRVK